MRRSAFLAIVVGLTTAGCGSNSSTSPSSVAPATIQGIVNGDGTGAGPLTASAAGVAATKAGIKVSVVGANLSTVSDSSGRFTLTGITGDHVTLHFEGPGIDAILEIGGLVPGQILTIKVRVSGNQADFDDNDDPAGGSSPQPSKCFAAGEKAEVEGKISKKGGADITVFQQGKGDYVCKVTASTSIRHGNTTFSFADLKVGDHVHVSGKGLASSGGACAVEAKEIKLQN